MTMENTPLINLMNAIYFTNHQKRQIVDFLKKYSCIIYVTNCLGCKFQKFTLKQNQKYQCPDTEIE